jgi:hypothetical protein
MSSSSRSSLLTAVPSFTIAKYCRKVCVRKHASTCSEYGSPARRPDTQCRIREGRRCKRGNPGFEGGLHSFNHAGMGVCTAPFSALLCAGRSLHSKDRVVGTYSCWNGLWCACGFMRHPVLLWWIEKVYNGAWMARAVLVVGDPASVYWWDGVRGGCHPWW